MHAFQVLAIKSVREQQKKALLQRLVESVGENKTALADAAKCAFEHEDAIRKQLGEVGLELRALPRQMDVRAYYTPKPIQSWVVVDFDADSMPNDTVIEQRLTRGLLALLAGLQGREALLAYTGIALLVDERWATYMQHRTIFKRMLVWWPNQNPNPNPNPEP